MSAKKIVIVGIGCAGSHLAAKLSEFNKVVGLEAGVDRTKDGYSYNLALLAPVQGTAGNERLFVAAQHGDVNAPPGPEWFGLFNSEVYNFFTTTTASLNGEIPAQTWSQGVMKGGASEHIQGVVTKPSPDRCNWWADITGNPNFLPDNLYPLLNEMEKFRSHTDVTTQTYDGSTFAPYDGPSSKGSKPINMGYDGVIDVMEEAPGDFAYSLSNAVYRRFQDLGFSNFTLQPYVSDVLSTTFNSGINTCVTRSPQRYLSTNRIRASTARAYLNDSVIVNDQPYIKSPESSNSNYLINTGSFSGINGHDLKIQYSAKAQRIVFKTKRGFPTGDKYWIPNYQPQASDFCHPLKAIGVEYVINGVTVFEPCDIALCSLGTLGTPALLMQSGIGPSDILFGLGIPVLLDQPNLGKHITNHAGCILKWKGNENFWGSGLPGQTASNGYLPGKPGTSPADRRVFQYYSGFTAATKIYVMNLYELQMKSTGDLSVVSAMDTVNKVIKTAVNPHTYENPEDQAQLCWLVRELCDMITKSDPTAVITSPDPATLSQPDSVLFPELMKTFTAQAHYVGSCGMTSSKNCNQGCVNNKFILRGTKNVMVCDASACPLDVDNLGQVYPVQNDGNTIRLVVSLTSILIKQFQDAMK